MVVFFKCFFIKLNNRKIYLIIELRNLFILGQIARKQSLR